MQCLLHQFIKGRIGDFKSYGSVTGKTLGRVKTLVFVKIQLSYHRLSLTPSTLRLARSTYYHWLDYQPSQHDCVDHHLKEIIRKILEENYRTYGYPRIKLEVDWEL
ncbi:hypothetical protein FD20_GL002381 [Liquorilactobacillus uvarum DSM 19971]|uniref:HTH-like domain-containing protein n=1 Tax=Liquorilactobacillus uvarum DSM 19971 TaxID=1423812 RepID=A0A0R1PKB1_9LACO|nr:hypothetical protein FD20_GL002381 [Liquorilactobacillus uvarum DSM 19971]